MFYPTGKSPNGSMVVCMHDEAPEISEALKDCDESCILECMTAWLKEKQCCVQSWQLKEYLKEMGIDEMRIDEDMSAGISAPAPSPMASLNNTPGMGPVQAPKNDGTNAGFHNKDLVGSGDKFPSLNVGTSSMKGKAKGKIVKNYYDFIKKKKK